MARRVRQTRCRRRFPHVKKGARSRPAVFTPAPVEAQHRNSADFARLSGWRAATRSTTPAATAAQQHQREQRSSAGLGGTSRRCSRSGLARPEMNAKPGSSYAPMVNKMSLAATGSVPLRRNRAGPVLLGNSLGVSQGLSAGFHPALRAVRIPRSCPSTVTSCPSRKTCSLSATETLSDSGGRAWNLTKNRGLTNCGSWCSARADRSIGRLAKGNAYKMRCAEKENAPRRNGVGSVRK